MQDQIVKEEPPDYDENPPIDIFETHEIKLENSDEDKLMRKELKVVLRRLNIPKSYRNKITFNLKKCKFLKYKTTDDNECLARQPRPIPVIRTELESLSPIQTEPQYENQLIIKKERVDKIVLMDDDDNTSIRCDICEKSFETPEDTQDHFSKVHSLPRTCYKCKKTLGSVDSLKRHVRSNRCIRISQFSYNLIERCSKRYFGEPPLLPVRIKNGPRVCYVCFRKLSDIKSYKRHMLCRHGLKNPEISAEVMRDNPPVVITMNKEFQKMFLNRKVDSYPERKVVPPPSSSKPKLKIQPKKPIVAKPQEEGVVIKREKPLLIWKCKVCSVTSEDWNFVNQHFAEHFPKTYDCSACGTSYKEKSDLDEHIKDSHYECSFCNDHFKNFFNLRTHKCPSRTTLYGYCPSTMCSPSELSSPPNVTEKILMCSACDIEFRSRLDWFIHKYHHDRGLYGCHQCNGAFLKKEALKAHLESHSEIKITTMLIVEVVKEANERFKCDVCDVTLCSEFEYERHVKNHSVDSYGCAQCKRVFKEKDEMIEHLESHMDIRFPSTLSSYLEIISSVEFTCGVCGCVFYSESELKKHCLNHQANRFSCSKCDDDFSNLIELKSHIASHRMIHIPSGACNVFMLQSLGVYNCETCDFQLSSECNFARHTVIHNTGRFGCCFCDEAFDTKSNLSEHVQTHNVIKLRATIVEEVLIEHSERYTCKLCQIDYNSEADYLKHKTGHETHFIPCTRCEIIFEKWEDLVVHWAIHCEIRVPSPLLKHLRTGHAMTFRCNMCKLELPSESEFVEHKRGHELGVYTCPECVVPVTKKEGSPNAEKDVKSPLSYLEVNMRMNMSETASESPAEVKQEPIEEESEA